MPGFVRQHLRPLVGAAGLHILLFALIVATAWRWSATRPPAPMAIEGVVVDQRSVPADAAPRRPAPAAPSAARPKPPEPVPAAPEPEPVDQAAERAREQDAAAQTERERAAEAAREQAATEARRAEEAERARQEKLAAEEAERKAVQAQAERRKAAEAERRKEAEEAVRREEAAEQQAREAELQRRLAAEEEEAASSVAASGVLDEYRAQLEQAIERSWIRPQSAQPGLECTLHVTQAPGGTVLDVRIGSCNGDAAVRESITNAVFRASPLPPPSDPRAFARRLEIVFRPTE
jgi:colicin import membrane protein